jgi:hypothetical protein
MEIEVFEIIKAVNRLKDSVNGLTTKIDRMSDLPALKIPPEYLDEAAVCRMLHIQPRTLAKLRANKVISCYKSGNKFLYLHTDIQQYLEDHCRHS